jgi:hypothetical protein
MNRPTIFVYWALNLFNIKLTFAWLRVKLNNQTLRSWL